MARAGIGPEWNALTVLGGLVGIGGGRTQVAGLKWWAVDELVGGAQREEVVAEALDEGFVADEDAGFDVLGVGGVGEVGGGDYRNAAVNNHALGMQAGPCLSCFG